MGRYKTKNVAFFHLFWHDVYGSNAFESWLLYNLSFPTSNTYASITSFEVDTFVSIEVESAGGMTIAGWAHPVVM